ncbi:MAG: cysteine hydrolase family protein, partial [Chloroflexota bacterium]
MKQEDSSRLLRIMRECADAIPKTLAEKVDPKHTAIIVVDMQNDFCHEEGVSAKRGMETRLFREVTPKLAEFLAQARRFHPLIVFIRTLYNEWSISPVCLQQQMRFPEHLRCFPREDTWGADLYGVSPQE